MQGIGQGVVPGRSAEKHTSSGGSIGLAIQSSIIPSDGRPRMPSVKCRVSRIGDPVSCTAQVSLWGLVQSRLPRMPPGDGTCFHLRTMSDSMARWRSF